MVRTLRSVQWRLAVRGFVGRSVFSLLTEVGIKGWSLTQAMKNMADSAASSSKWLWVRGKVVTGKKLGKSRTTFQNEEAEVSCLVDHHDMVNVVWFIGWPKPKLLYLCLLAWNAAGMLADLLFDLIDGSCCMLLSLAHS